MRLTWHLTRHNLASLRLHLAAWAGVLFVQSLVLHMGPPEPDGLPGPPMSLDVAALVMRLALTVVFVSALVLRHPVVGTTAFWRTRPIPRADLFLSTLTTFAIVVAIVPTAWMAATFWWFGFDAAHAAQAASRVIVEQVLFGAMAWILAALTRNLAQAIVGALTLMTALWVGLALVAFLPRRPLPFSLIVRQAEWADVWVMGAATLLFVALAAHQYLTLRTWRSYAFVGTAVAVVLLSRPFPMIRWAGGTSLPLAPVSLDTRMTPLDRASIRTGNVTRVSASGARVDVSQSARFEGADPTGAVILRPMAVQSRVRFPDGVTERFDSAQVTPWVDGAPESAAARQPWTSIAAALGGIELAEPGMAARLPFRMTFLEVPPDLYATRSTQPAQLDMNVTFDAVRYAVVARAPFSPGARAAGGDYALEFEGTTPVENGLGVILREVHMAGAFARPQYVIVNQARRQAVAASGFTATRFRCALGSFATPAVWRQRLTFDPPTAITLDAEWLAGAEIVVLRTRSLGRVIHGARETGYTLAPPHAAPAPSQD